MPIKKTTTNYYNHTKANNAPAFKGQFLDDDGWHLKQVDISTDRRNDINEFFILSLILPFSDLGNHFF